MAIQQNIYEQRQQLIDWYGDGDDSSCPTALQWENLLSRREVKPFTLINFFKLRERAEYPKNSNHQPAAMSGSEAFERYSAVSIATMETDSSVRRAPARGGKEGEKS